MGSIGVCGPPCQMCAGNCWPLGFPDDWSGEWYCGICRVHRERGEWEFYTCLQVPQINALANRGREGFDRLLDFLFGTLKQNERQVRQDTRRAILSVILHPLRDRYCRWLADGENEGCRRSMESWLLRHRFGDVLDYIIEFLV